MSSRSSAAAATVVPKPPPSSGTRKVTRKGRQALQHDEPLPAVDERLVMPETRAEIINGKVYFVPPSDEPHGSTHIDLGAVVRAHLASGYSGALEMLTRTSKDNDFAPDASVYPSERDPETGGRKLEEIAFEIVSKQSLSISKRKARELVKRGVRRVFCIVLKKRQVSEWSRVTDTFEPLPEDYRIEDRCFIKPLPVQALLNGTQSARAIVEALRAREDATLMAMLDEAQETGVEKGIEKGIEKGRELERLDSRRESLFLILHANGHTIDDTTRSEIERCSDVATLERWIVDALRRKSIGKHTPSDLLDPP